MKLSNLVVNQIKNCHLKVSCEVFINLFNTTQECFFEITGARDVKVQKNYDYFVIGLLPLALTLGENLEVEDSIDLQLHNNLCDAIALFKTWFPSEGKESSMIFNDFRLDTPHGTRISSFFSGGVDALFNSVYFDSIYPNRPIDDLVLVHGMDIALDDHNLWEMTYSKLLETSKELDKNLIVVKTNIRDFHKGKVNYTHMGFGPILGSISNLLSSSVRLSLIGSYGLFSELAPHASGPLVDRLWSSSSQNVTHFTPRFTRLQKIEIINKLKPEALKNLRVCWKNSNSDYNCGLCEKCLRTRMELKILGALEMARSFPNSDIEIDIKALGDNIPEDDIYTYYFWKEIYNLETNDSILRSIKRSIDSYLKRRRKHILSQKSRKAFRYLKSKF
jgi:hypothetical protein